ncbi:MAG: universal stress protein, partial [Chloroflexi bacterium]|nr:universal stress protein [Chloroflexota bacterium]
MVENSIETIHSAIEDFHRVRRQAAMQQILARFTGRSVELLDYEDVRRKLRATNRADRGLHEVPLDAIVGSVGRVKDFTRTFLPKSDSDQQRWANVKTRATGLTGLPPIELYQLGDVYFVIDGNHRVSIARRLEAETIQAYVTEVKIRVPLTPTDNPEEIIAKARYVEFLERTNLDRLRPEADLQMKINGQYRVLLEHIDVHQYYMGLDFNRDIPYEEAVTHWHEYVYMPIVQMIRVRGMLRDFSQFLEADLYLLIAEHQEELKKDLGWEVETETAVSDMSGQKSNRPGRVLSRIGERLLDAVTPDELEAGPPPGQWRKDRVLLRRDDRLFHEILVAIGGEVDDWRVLDLALSLAQVENGRILGLHIIPPQKNQPNHQLNPNQQIEQVATIQAEFARRCDEAGVAGSLAIEHGTVARKIVERAAYADVVVLPLNNPPGNLPLQRLASGLVTIIKRCPRPIITVPIKPTLPMDRILLAYNGSPKSREALFVATYLASREHVDLTVVAINKNADAADLLDEARSYLAEHGISVARFVEKTAVNRPKAILDTAKMYNCNLLLLGGFLAQPWLHAVLGSNVDEL